MSGLVDRRAAGSRRRLTAALAAASAGVLVLTSCSGGGGEPIDVAAVGRADVSEYVEAPATVAARSTATVVAPATGTIARLYVQDGDRVRPDQRLLRIDSPQAEAALSSARQAAASVAGVSAPSVDGSGTAEALRAADDAVDQAFDQARDANQAIPDPQQRAAATAQLRAARAQYAAARAAVARASAQVRAGANAASGAVASLAQAQRAQAQAAVTAAQSTVDSLTVRAPVAGVVAFGSGESGSGGGSDLSSLLGQLPSAQQDLASSVLGGASGSAAVSGELTRGAPVSRGQDLLTVTDSSRLSLAAQVDETDVLLVRRGVRADVELAAVPGATYRAKVRVVAPNATQSARGGVSYVVALRLGAGRTAEGEPAPRPRAGMSAVARLRVRSATDAVAVPAAAVVRDGARSSVWIVDDGVARKRTVRLGAQGEAEYQVLDGLLPGDRIVVRGADRVSDGQRVG